MGNIICLTKVASNTELQQQHLPSTHELGLGPMIAPEAESAMVNQQASRRIKVVITKEQFQQLVSKEISIHDILMVQKAEKCSPDGPSTNICWSHELESIPEENEISPKKFN